MVFVMKTAVMTVTMTKKSRIRTSIVQRAQR